jgi:oligopeptide/dipeptide ABC transporter ATP-binding protein
LNAVIDPFTSPSSRPIETLLEVEDLRTYFYTEEGEVRAVDGVSFELGRGRTLALVGESGCGKSVTAYSILRLINPPGRIVSGAVRLHRRDGSEPLNVLSLSDTSDELFEVRGGRAALIFQEATAALSPVHTIGNQITEAIQLHQQLSRKGAGRIAAEMLDRVGIADPQLCLRQYPHELSGGMRQRAIIAMALVTDPELLIADEPTTALDVTIQAQILSVLKKLQSALGTSILLITHDLAVVAQMADEVVVMDLGRVVERASVRAIMNKPRHPYTMGLIASLPSLTPVGQRLPSIKGSVPALTDIPAGCAFHPRCPYSEPGLCDTGEPPTLVQLGSASGRPPSSEVDSEVPDESGPRESRPPVSGPPATQGDPNHAAACHRVREIALERLLERPDAPASSRAPQGPTATAEAPAAESTATDPTDPTEPEPASTAADSDPNSDENAWFEEGERLSERPGSEES